VAIIFDDMISTAGSICGAAQAVKDAGAIEVHVAASHGVLCGHAREKIDAAPIDSVVVTDSINIAREQRSEKLKFVTVAPLLAEAIRRIHHDQSISQMFGDNR
jgi:ribose-phosphate pyrophosphokinase